MTHSYVVGNIKVYNHIVSCYNQLVNQSLKSTDKLNKEILQISQSSKAIIHNSLLSENQWVIDDFLQKKSGNWSVEHL